MTEEAPVADHPQRRARGLLTARADLLVMTPIIAVVAFVVRLEPLLRGGGIGSYGRYDDGVYYAAADALIHGRTPYRGSFVLLHPPGLMLVLTPFAWLGRVTSDHTGMTVGRLAFMGIGALNAVLIAVLARRWSRSAAIIGGTLYAVWNAAVYAEETTLLEPLGTTALLIALLLLVRRAERPTIRAEVLTGIALGAAVTLKIWYVAPFAAIVVWQLLERRIRSTARIIAAGAATVVVIVLPFAVMAPGQMWNMVIRDQLLRPAGAKHDFNRVTTILGVRSVLPQHHHVLSVAAASAVAIVVIAIAVLGCVLDRDARMLLLPLSFNLAVLLAGPSFFGHYAHLTAAPIALVVAIGLSGLAHRLQPRAVPAALVVVALLFCAYSGYRVARRPQGNPINGALLAHAAPPGCIAADSDEILIQMNRLSRDFESGCRVLIDVSGITYGSLHLVGPDGRPVPRSLNPEWQRYLFDYLSSASAFVAVRGVGDLGVVPFHRLAQFPVLARSHHVVLHAGAR